jgi:hypothetical protein
MDPRVREGVVIRLTDRARYALRPGEVLVFDWHRIAICCAVAGDTSVRPVPRARLAGPGGSRFRPVRCDPPDTVLVHERAVPHLAGLDVLVDCRTVLGVRTFSPDLPTDFGLRASLGRVPGRP